jgi:hypothetical protein
MADLNNRIFHYMEKLLSAANYQVPIERDTLQKTPRKRLRKQRLQHVPVTPTRYIYQATVIDTTGVVTIHDRCDPPLVERVLN